jgi:hypothetical protein
MYTRQFPGFHHHPAATHIRKRKDAIIGPNVLGDDIFSKPLTQPLGDENALAAPPALGSSDVQLAIIDVSGRELKNFTNPHPAPGHQFEHEAIPLMGCPEDDFVNTFSGAGGYRRGSGF